MCRVHTHNNTKYKIRRIKKKTQSVHEEETIQNQNLHVFTCKPTFFFPYNILIYVYACVAPFLRLIVGCLNTEIAIKIRNNYARDCMCIEKI